jgi:hypothetical protein
MASLHAAQEHRNEAIEKLCFAFQTTSAAERAGFIAEAIEQFECAVLEVVRSDIEAGRIKVPEVKREG